MELALSILLATMALGVWLIVSGHAIRERVSYLLPYHQRRNAGVARIVCGIVLLSLGVLVPVCWFALEVIGGLATV